MKVAVFSSTPLWPVHHAESIEIALDLIARGNKVIYILCTGRLNSCAANSGHSENLCIQCRRQSEYTVNVIFREEVQNGSLLPQIIELDEREDFFIPELTSIEHFRRFELESFPIGEQVLSQLFDDADDIFINTSTLSGRGAQLLLNGLRLYRFTRSLIRAHSIKALYQWNGRRPSDGPALWAAKHEGIYYAAFISGQKPGTYTLQNTFRVNSLEYVKSDINKTFDEALNKRTEKYIMEEAKRAFDTLRYGYNIPYNFPHFAKTFNSNVEPSIAHDRVNVTFYMSGFHENVLGGDYLKNNNFANQYEVLIQILRNKFITTNFNCIVRYHPSVKYSKGIVQKGLIQKISSQFAKEAQHFMPDSEVDSYKLMASSDIVVTFGSTIGIEACYYSKPHILLGRSQYEDLMVCYRPRDLNELFSLLAKGKALAPSDRLGAIKYGYWLRNGSHIPFRFLKCIWDDNRPPKFFRHENNIDVRHTNL